MATQEYAASIQGVSIRVTRLDAAGNLLNGAGDSYVTSAFMRVSFTPEYEEGDEITEKNANGIVCVTYKSPDVLKRITMELAICEPDSELSQLISGGLLLRQNIDGVSKSIGWAAPGVGDDPAGNGVAIEVWSHAVSGGKRASMLPYFHWVFPFVKMRQSGDRVIENGMLATTFEGYGLGNPNFGSALDGRWLFPVAAERPYSYARSEWAPQGLQGFYTWSDNSTQPMYFTKSGIQGATDITISNANAIANVATILLANTAAGASNIASLGLVTGDVIAVKNLGDPFNTGSDGVSITMLESLSATQNIATTSTTIRVADTTGLYAGLTLVKVSGTGTLASGAYIASIPNTTAFTVNASAVTANGTLTFSAGNAISTAFYYATTANLDSGVTGSITKNSRVTVVDSATESPNYVAVTAAQIDTAYANGVSNTGNYNVPGGSNYNPDNDVDFIIKAND
jgi:hypothetical protein